MDLSSLPGDGLTGAPRRESRAAKEELLGQYSVIVTERYAHLLTDLFTGADHAILSPVRPAEGQRPERRRPTPRSKRTKAGAVL